MELRKSLRNAKGTAQVGNTRKAYNTDVCNDGGCNRSSEEVFVMNMERRVAVLQVLNY